MSLSQSQSQSQSFTVAIVGGGIIGVVLALALRHRGIDVEIFERGSSLTEVSASMGVNISAVEALKVCGPEAYGAFLEVATKPSDPKIALEFRDGFFEPSKGGWTVPWDGHLTGVHRGQFLEALVKRLPSEIVHFGKNLVSIDETPETGDVGDERIRLHFADGSAILADAVVGADGVGSRVRRHLLRSQHHSARARYAHQYVYRTVLSMDDAVRIVGKQHTQRITQWMGKDAHIATVPIGQGELFGLTAIVRDASPWPSDHKMVLPATKEEVVRRFRTWGPEIRALIDAIDPVRVDRWALFDLAENPLPFYARGRIVLAGDSAHATVPHQGSGAMCGMEDAAVLAELLADERMRGRPERLSAAFRAYGQVRLPRGHWLTGSSRRTGDLLDFADPVAREDMRLIQKMVMDNFEESWSSAVHEHVRLAKSAFAKLLEDSRQG